MKLLLLGGAGTMAGFALEKMLADGFFDEIIVADYNEAAAKEVVAKSKSDKLTARAADVHNKELLIDLMNQVDVVANCTGPYYLLLKPVMDAFFESNCKNYVDFCDDFEAIEALMTDENQELAKRQGQTLIIGLGGSPGLIPVEIMYGASLLDKTDTVQLSMLMDEKEEGGPAVWDHMFENFYGELNTFENGELVTVQGLSEVIEFPFPEEVFGDIGTVKLYDLGHPEVFTIPKAIPEVQNVKIKCAFYPRESMEYVINMAEQGFLDTEKVNVDGVEVSPRGVFLKMLEGTLMNPDYPGGFQPYARDPEDRGTGTVIDIIGEKDGKKAHFVSAFTADMGTLTGYPLALGAVLLSKGEIPEKGILIPEDAIVKRKEFVDEVFNSIKELGHPVKKIARVTYDL
ncbi:MAG: saccharopine dehydrogenase C-terminal domain-containing protein [Tissierellia bacterium]|nr:saccharopine dehydrogenase C-terminal domain-containing protein [Tissierellia bacterium]